MARITSLLLIALANAAFSTPLDLVDDEEEAKLTPAEQKCQEYRNSSVASKVATNGEVTHMARIGYKYHPDMKIDWFCEGTLISEYYVLSGVYCVSEKYIAHIILGSFHQDPSLDPSSQEYRATKTYENDIALFKLDRKVEFNQHIRPICLNTKPDLEFQQATMSGWHVNTPGSNSSEDLKTINRQVLSDKTCIDTYNATGRRFNMTTMICAKLVDQDACNYDRGGPLQVTVGKSNTYLQIGITTYETGCGKMDIPTTFNRVSAYVSWIESIVWS